MRFKPVYNWAFFSGVALLIFGPLLATGYILTLDLSWGPHMAPASIQDNGWALHEFIIGLTKLLPSQLVEKLILLAIFVLSGVGASRLASRTSPGWPATVGGLIYVVNPFTYERLLAGQWLVLAGYALLPWFVNALVHLLERPKLSRSIVLAIWVAALGMVSLHIIAMAGLIAVIVSLAHVWGRGKTTLRKLIPYLTLAALLAFAASFVWLGPLLLHRSPTASVVSSFNSDQFKAFATSGGDIGAPANVLTLQGFWGDYRGLVATASSTGPWFYLASILVVAMVILGIIVSTRRKDRLAIALVISAVIAWILAIGIAWPPSAWVTHFLISHVPFYRGYREPEKWVLVLALAYSYLSAVSVAYLRDLTKGFWKSAITISAFLLPIIWVPMIFWGAAGQLTAAEYPQDWNQLNTKLNAYPPAPIGHPDTLVLPWHQYIYLDFARRTVANPAPGFFDRPTIVSNDPELPGLTPETGNSLASLIQNNVINRSFFEDNAGSELSRLGVHFIVLLKVADWSNYGWLKSQSDLQLVAETPDWQLYTTQARP